ncbi:MAG: hypothetical protein H6551_10770 [Chitinophagales bacterium]|nr:hypothetical protein [Chitinophagaceae bacterium]MCB9065612.1 hypothetical protein [Chitinophagales bacterium]
MYKYIALLIMAVSLAAAGCKDTDPHVNDNNNELMRKTLKETYPSLKVSQIRIEVKDFQDITILLGDKELYNETDETLQQVADNIAAISYGIYESNNYLDEGKVIITPNETASEQSSASGDEKKEFSFEYDKFKKDQ